MLVDLTTTQLYMIEQLLAQEVNFCNEEPEHEEEIKAQVKPYEKLLEKLRRYKIKKKVTVEVYGGVAECTHCPKGVVVDIVDHDNENAG